MERTSTLNFMVDAYSSPFPISNDFNNRLVDVNDFADMGSDNQGAYVTQELLAIEDGVQSGVDDAAIGNNGNHIRVGVNDLLLHVVVQVLPNHDVASRDLVRE